MTSAQNLLPQLNGNSRLIASVLLLALLACGTARKAGGIDEGGDSAAAVKVYDPTSGRYVPVEDPLALVDTVSWTEDTSSEPLRSAETGPRRKDSYDISLMLPMTAGDSRIFYEKIPPKPRRFLHYYSGVLLALDELTEQGIDLNTTVYDTRESEAVFRNQLKEAAKSDLVIGPYTRSNLAEASRFASRNKVPVVSPWLPSVLPEEESPYFIQLTPGLETHAIAAMQFAGDSLSSAKFFLVARDDNRDDSRFQLYEQAFRENVLREEPIEKLIVSDVSADLTDIDVRSIIDSTRTNVFFMPYFLRSEESFVNAFLRKLHAERRQDTFYVIGLPQWLNYSKIDPDYLEALNTHITVAQYKDETTQDVIAFNEKFFQRFEGIPDDAAWQGYQAMLFLGRTLDMYGPDFTKWIEPDAGPVHGISLRPVFARGTVRERRGKVRYYENQHLEILRFRDQRFRPADEPRRRGAG